MSEPASLETPHDRFQRFEELLRCSLKELAHKIAQGEAFLVSFDQHDCVKRLLEELRDAVAMDRTVHLASTDQSFLLKYAALAEEKGDLEAAEGILSMLMAIDSEDAQATIALLNMVWRHQGVAVAADCYRVLIPYFRSPVFLACAAECLTADGADREARALAQEAVEHLPPDSELSPQEREMANAIRAVADSLS